MKDFITPIQAIRKMCLECCNGQQNEIINCMIERCPLYDFRIGAKPQRKSSNDTNEQISLDILEEV